MSDTTSTTASLADGVRSAIGGALAETATTQAMLARRLGVTQKHVSEVLTGRAGLSMDLADAMLAAMGRRVVVAVEHAPLRELPMPLTADRVLKDGHRVAWRCPIHSAARAEVTSNTKDAARQVAELAWAAHIASDHQPVEETADA